MMRKIIFTISTFILTLLTMMFSSCGEAEFEYSSAPCYLIIDNSLHHDATLASALTQYSGTYVTITKLPLALVTPPVRKEESLGLSKASLATSLIVTFIGFSSCVIGFHIT